MSSPSPTHIEGLREARASRKRHVPRCSRRYRSDLGNNLMRYRCRCCPSGSGRPSSHAAWLQVGQRHEGAEEQPVVGACIDTRSNRRIARVSCHNDLSAHAHPFIAKSTMKRWSENISSYSRSNPSQCCCGSVSLNQSTQSSSLYCRLDDVTARISN